jgi:hypothetical protein
MKLFIEALFVGVYTISIYFLIYFFTINTFLHLHEYMYLQIFVVGFLKHFLGYYLGIQSYYCNTANKKVVLPIHLFLFSILEGFVFIFLSIIFTEYIKSISLTLFFIGFTMHLLAEISGVHKYFLTNMCK